MTETQMWMLIDSSRAAAAGSVQRQSLALTAALSGQSQADIAEFDKHFRDKMAESYTSDLWAAAYIIEGGCSDDGFEYFRAWLIGQGAETFNSALKDPESLAATAGDSEPEERDGELLMYSASKAYEKATGFALIPAFVQSPEIDIKWDEASVGHMYPKLTEAFE